MLAIISDQVCFSFLPGVGKEGTIVADIRQAIWEAFTASMCYRPQDRTQAQARSEDINILPPCCVWIMANKRELGWKLESVGDLEIEGRKHTIVHSSSILVESVHDVKSADRFSAAGVHVTRRGELFGVVGNSCGLDEHLCSSFWTEIVSTSRRDREAESARPEQDYTVYREQ